MITRGTFIKAACALPLSLGQTPAPLRVKAPQPKWLEDIAIQLRTEFDLPAVWVAANVDGQIDAAVVGVRKLGAEAPAALEDKLTIASVSKPMVGLWIATLVEKGLLTYQSRVLEVLPELQQACLPEHKNITLGDLLSHRAGVQRDTSTSSDKLPLKDYPKERLRMARELLTAPAPAGSKGNELYSNNGVTLAATMAERAAREQYEVAAGRFYREQLGLKSWDVWPMNLTADLNTPWPHKREGGRVSPSEPSAVQVHFVRPSGSAVCSISDLVRFGLLVVNGSRASERILRSGTWQTVLDHGDGARTTLGSIYGIGRDCPVFNHGGSLGPTATYMQALPAMKFAVACHTNAQADKFSARGNQLLMDAVRKRRSRLYPPANCRITLTGVTTTDSQGTEIKPTSADEKLSIKVVFFIETGSRTGDLQTMVKVGEEVARDERYMGLGPGEHTLYFNFPIPKSKSTPVTVTVDSLGTSGNIAGGQTTFSSNLMVD